jgi:hypothetical protein
MASQPFQLILHATFPPSPLQVLNLWQEHAGYGGQGGVFNGVYTPRCGERLLVKSATSKPRHPTSLLEQLRRDKIARPRV